MTANIVPRELPPPGPDRVRLGGALTVSLAIHALIISLQFGVPGVGLPSLELPWRERRAQAIELQVVIANPAGGTAAEIPAEAPPAPTAQAVSAPAQGLKLVPLPRVTAKPPAKQAKAKSRPRTAVTARRPRPRPNRETPVIALNETRENTFNMPAPARDEIPPPDRPEAVPSPEAPEPAVSAAPEEPAAPQHGQAAPTRAEEEAAQQEREEKEREARRQAEEAERRQAEARAARQQIEAARRQEEEAAHRHALALEAQRAEEAARHAAALALQKQREEALRREREETARRALELEEKQRAEALRQQAEQAQRARREAMELQARKQAAEAAEAARQQAAAREREKQAEELAARRKTEADAAHAASAARREPAPELVLGDSPAPGARIDPLPRNLAGGGLAGRALEQARQSDNSMETPRRRSIFGGKDVDVGLMMYVESWRLKIERNGSINYPRASVEKAHGDPVVTVAIRSDGSVEDIVIHRSSGRPELDDAVRRIVKVNARYSAFPPELARRFDVIEIRRVWNFDDRLRILEEVR